MPNPTGGVCPNCSYYTYSPEQRDCSGAGTIFDCNIVEQVGTLTQYNGVCVVTPLGQFVCVYNSSVSYYNRKYNGAIASVHPISSSCYY